MIEYFGARRLHAPTVQDASLCDLFEFSGMTMDAQSTHSVLTIPFSLPHGLEADLLGRGWEYMSRAIDTNLLSLTFDAGVFISIGGHPRWSHQALHEHRDPRGGSARSPR